VNDLIRETIALVRDDLEAASVSVARTCPPLGVKRTSVDALQMSAFDPKRTF